MNDNESDSKEDLESGIGVLGLVMGFSVPESSLIRIGRSLFPKDSFFLLQLQVYPSMKSRHQDTWSYLKGNQQVGQDLGVRVMMVVESMIVSFYWSLLRLLYVLRISFEFPKLLAGSQVFSPVA